MQVLAAVACAVLGAFVLPLQAQDRPARDTTPLTQQLPRAVATEVVRLYEEPQALRRLERTEIAAGQTIAGNVAVVDGPLIIAGTVTGRVLAINSDVILHPTARIGGDLLVVGGDIEGERDAEIGGEIRVYRPSLRFRRDGDRIAVDEEERPAEEDSWWRRWERRRARSGVRPVIASAGAYNRVEGLPVNIGPVAQLRPRWGAMRLEAFAVVRTGSSFRSDTTDIGYDITGTVVRGRSSGLRLQGRLFDVNEPVESWQMSPLEYGLAAFLVRRDYQDFYARHGGSGRLTAFDEDLGELSVSYAHERWTPRSSEDPFTLFRGGADWRENPELDAGRIHLLKAAARFDTRNDDDRPWSGWLIAADVERGTGELETLGPTPAGTRTTVPGRVAYTRGFMDARRYNRVGPGAQLNFRLVAGGWLGGDDLPLQRRVSVSGAGALPGFDFRTPIAVDDGATCTGPADSPPEIIAGRPALCDRIALAQVEYRGDLHFDLFGGFDWTDRDLHFRNDATWVVFADAGRGWLVGPRAGTLRYGRGELPPPGTFRTDVGMGLDLGRMGIFVAKALSHGEPPNFLFRIGHRF